MGRGTASMTAPPLHPQITCRFWQAPYSLRPQVGPIGGLIVHSRRRRVIIPAAPAYETDVEDDLQYGLRNKYAWVWQSLEEIGDGDGDHHHHAAPPHLEDGFAVVDFPGDYDLSDSDGSDDSFEVMEAKKLP